ncbi:TetR/AcrR family transcriptional regulator C-terminal domain-containing protein [Mesorhizobium sp. LHD-90]|uniref:TetR/AcrR family transcriptional regulator n=1 Tax=Mesorhizobium sp. LHD-90 TaxID=3071414 RepID=UPI0027E1F98A|nr:TetR/AcrR family transcriptional regulator C-terminal domain-containing protein [Mesorhizobium sp. LHD-90]MDQ6435515.1 TetR/AcrR family transcriptional regulator C-terminal domain-containing protein [Mesorhizobium sp. LHD-90]
MASQPSGAGSKRPKRTSVWLQPVKEQRSEPPLSRERIVAAAVELLDSEGIEGLTMRRLAERLGSGVMSLYWHVDNKEDVFDLALDSALEYRGPPQVAESRDWRNEVVHMLEDWRANMLRHPWSASLLERPAFGPNVLGRLELLSRTLSRAGVPDADLNVSIWSLYNYVMGATIARASLDLSDDDRAVGQQRLTRLRDLYPTLERTRLLLDNDWDGVFRKGLDFLLDGLAPRR